MPACDHHGDLPIAVDWFANEEAGPRRALLEIATERNARISLSLQVAGDAQLHVIDASPDAAEALEFQIRAARRAGLCCLREPGQGA